MGRLWWGMVCVVSLLATEGMAGEFYRCENEGEPPVSFRKEACQLLTDPTQPGSTTHSLPSLPPSPPPVTDQTPPSAGPWTVTQLFFPDADPSSPGGYREAIINNRRVAIGTLVDGGRVQAITRTGVLMVHAGGETEIPFGRETTATGFIRPPALSVSLEELGLDLARLRALQQVANGKEWIITHEGTPLARLLPVIPEKK